MAINEKNKLVLSDNDAFDFLNDSYLRFLAYFSSKIYSKSKKNIYEDPKIKKLYMEFLRDYKNFINNFELKNPVEIQTMFNYMLYKGLLSMDKKFVFEQNYLEGLVGTSIMSGYGVCRNIEAMLNDLFQTLSVESYVLPVYADETEIGVQGADPLTCASIDELYDYINSNVLNKNDREYYFDLIKKFGNRILFYKEKPTIKNYLAKTKGNHVVSLTSHKGFTHIIDSTQKEPKYYKLTKNGLINQNKSFRNEDDDILLPIKVDFFNQTKEAKLRIKEILKQPSTSSFEDQQVRNKTLELIRRNQDLLEWFYIYHKTLYQEIDYLNNRQYVKGGK